MIIGGFGGDGIAVSGSDDLVDNNDIGTGPAGITNLGNLGDGIGIDSTGDTIGGTAAGAGNIISGNLGNGVEITRPNPNASPTHFLR